MMDFTVKKLCMCVWGGEGEDIQSVFYDTVFIGIILYFYFFKTTIKFQSSAECFCSIKCSNSKFIFYNWNINYLIITPSSQHQKKFHQTTNTKRTKKFCFQSWNVRLAGFKPNRVRWFNRSEFSIVYSEPWISLSK